MILVEKIQIPALPTKKPRRLYVYLPRGYDETDERYPVLYMFDGHNVFYDSHATFGKSWGMKQYLQRTKQKLIVVAVESNREGNRRIFEYAPWSFFAGRFGPIEGLGKVTMDWITKDLKPEIDRCFRTLPDRAHTLIAGSSMGGLMALYAVTAYNDVFSRAAALSPSPWISTQEMKKCFSVPLKKPTRVYIDMGTGEAHGLWQPMATMFNVAKTLNRAGADVFANMIPGAEHNEAAWEKRIPDFFRYLLTQ